MEELGRYSTDVAELGLSPERGNRYAYVLDPAGKILMPCARHTGARGSIIAADSERFPEIRNDELLAGLPPVLAGGVKPGIKGVCPDCSFTVACVGNIDSDVVLDVWSLSSEDRVDERGDPIPAGEPHNDVNDIKLRLQDAAQWLLHVPRPW